MSVKKKLSILRNVLIFTAIAWFLVTFLIVPVLSTVKTTFFTDGAFSMQSVQKLLSSERVKRSLSNTYKMAFWRFQAFGTGLYDAAALWRYLSRHRL